MKTVPTFGQAELEALYTHLDVKPHPVLILPTLEQVRGLLAQDKGMEQLVGWLRTRDEKLRLMELDPLNHGFEPKMWLDADRIVKEYRRIAVIGPNRIGKTEWAGKHVVKHLRSKPGARWWCLCESHETSVRGGGQQEVIWKYLPVEWKELNHKRGLTASISYTEKNRFAENVFIGPEKQECRFMNYSQDIKVIEGGSIDGYWGDELIGIEWVKTLDGRLVDRDGEGIVTFTPIYGWNETLGLFLQGGQVTETRSFPLFPDMKLWPGLKPGEIPYLVISIDGKRAAIFFQLKENPYVPWERLVKQWSSSSVPEQLVRLAGVTQKKQGNQFPKFGKHNLVPASKIPKEGTNYHLIDFGWNKNWFMLWIRVQRLNGKRRIFVYREWPDHGTHGEWAVRSSKPNGDRGPAQSPVGHSIREYKQLIMQLEGHKAESGKVGKRESGTSPETIYLRYGDPRSGRATVVTDEEGGTCIIDMMAESQEDAPPMEVLPAKGVLIGEGINLIRQWMEYNDERAVDVMNEPEFYVSEECKNTIDCLQLWTGKGSEAEQHSKDPIDLLRYAAVEDIDDVGSCAATGRRGRGF